MEVTETFVGDGAYDKNTFSKSILFSDQNLDFLGTYLWVLDVYKTYTNLMPVIDQLMDLPDAEMNPSVLFAPEFMAGIVNETDHAFIATLGRKPKHELELTSPYSFFQRL